MPGTFRAPHRRQVCDACDPARNGTVPPYSETTMLIHPVSILAALLCAGITLFALLSAAAQQLG